MTTYDDMRQRMLTPTRVLPRCPHLFKTGTWRNWSCPDCGYNKIRMAEIIPWYIPNRFKRRRETWRDFVAKKGRLLKFPKYEISDAGLVIDKRRFKAFDLLGPETGRKD